MKKKQRFYLMIETDKEIEPKDILFALGEARPDWGLMSASIAAQQSVEPTRESLRRKVVLKLAKVLRSPRTAANANR